MVAKLYDTNTSLNIPKHAGHVTRAGDDLPVTDKTTAAEVSGMSTEFASALDIGAILAVQVVDRTDVVQTSTGNVIARWRICAGHDPTRPERDGVHFIGCVSVPNDEFSILRGGNEMSSVGGPMHGINFGEMASEGSSRTHDDSGQSFDICSHSSH